MKLSPKAFNKFLRFIGQDMTWQKAYQCPCRNIHSGGADPTCTVCKGKGTYWGDAVSVCAGLSGMQVQKQWFDFGLAEMGDVVITVPSDTAMYGIGQFDRVIMSDSTQPFSLVMTRGGPEEFIPFTPTSIDYVTVMDNGEIKELDKPSSIVNGIPQWMQNEPTEGTVYTIAGRKNQEYFVYQDFPQERANSTFTEGDMYTIKVDLPELPQAIENALSQLVSNITGAVEKTAIETTSAWQAGIMKASGVWLEHKKQASQSIDYQMTSPFTATVSTEDPIAERIENGFPERDLKDMLQTSQKVRASKQGKKYLYIPFRHNTTGNDAHANSMPADIYAKAKKLTPSSVVGMGKRLSATGAVVPQAKYKWGDKLPAGLAPKKKDFHTTDIYASMVKMQTSAGKGKSSAYMTFRTMSEGSSKWLVPAKPGHNILQTLAPEVKVRLEKNLQDAIQQALS